MTVCHQDRPSRPPLFMTTAKVQAAPRTIPVGPASSVLHAWDNVRRFLGPFLQTSRLLELQQMGISPWPLTETELQARAHQHHGARHGVTQAWRGSALGPVHASLGAQWTPTARFAVGMRCCVFTPVPCSAGWLLCGRACCRSGARVKVTCAAFGATRTAALRSRADRPTALQIRLSFEHAVWTARFATCSTSGHPETGTAS